MPQKSRRENHEFFSCIRKRVFYDALTATKACLSIHRQDPGSYLHIYHCIYCSGVHITSGGIKGHLKGIKKILKANLKLMSRADWWIRCPEDIRESLIQLEINILKEKLYYEYRGND